MKCATRYISSETMYISSETRSIRFEITCIQVEVPGLKQNIQFHSFRGLRLEFIFIFGHALLTFAIQYSRNNSTFLRVVESRLKRHLRYTVLEESKIDHFRTSRKCQTTRQDGAACQRNVNTDCLTWEGSTRKQARAAQQEGGRHGATTRQTSRQPSSSSTSTPTPPLITADTPTSSCSSISSTLPDLT